MNIGITIHLTQEHESIWQNGIKLNALYLLKALKAIGYNAYILNNGPFKRLMMVKFNGILKIFQFMTILLWPKILIL